MSNQTAFAALALRVAYEAQQRSHAELDRTKPIKDQADKLTALMDEKMARIERGRFNARWALDQLEFHNVNDTWVRTAALTGPQQRGIDHRWVGTSLEIFDPIVGDYVSVGDLRFTSYTVFTELFVNESQFFSSTITHSG